MSIKIFYSDKKLYFDQQMPNFQPMDRLDTSQEGLRTRKKSRRRREILSAARALFEQDGYDATTMARIAKAADVSTPTVFNYFGAKDDLIMALVLEGHLAAREEVLNWTPDPTWSLGQMLGELMSHYLDLTMEIAGKRIWRYAEATYIRRPDSAVSRIYHEIETNHVSEIQRFVQPYTDGPDAQAKAGFLAKLVYHHWDTLFHDFLRTEARSIAQHKDIIRRDMNNLERIVRLKADP